MSVVNVTHNRFGWRTSVLGHRCHHGLVGLLLTLAGIAAMLHDRHDFPWA